LGSDARSGSGSRIGSRRKALGDRGEQAVTEWYLARGFSLVARNWRCASGEIDVVVRLGQLLVMCEVKTRTSDRFGAPEESVTSAKVRRLRRLAAAFLSDARDSGLLNEGSGRSSSPGGLDVRFDVASVTVDRGQLTIDVIESAF
jgi:putative endonuclease